MFTDAAKAIVQRIHNEVLSKGNMDVVNELFAPDHVSHGMPPEMPVGVEGIKLCFNQSTPSPLNSCHQLPE